MLLLLLVACKPPPAYVTDGPGVALSDLRAEGVGLAPVALVRDLPAPPLPPPAPPGKVEEGLEISHLAPPTVLDPVADGPFLRNDYIGNIRFGGGYILTGDVALETRARLIEFNQQDAYVDLGRQWLGDAVTHVLDERHLRVTPVDVAAPGPGRVPIRGTNAEDGRDNLNLPRVRLAPGPAPDATGQRFVLVPYLRAYYTHNGGWFLGQKYGCMGGARIEVFLVLYDTTQKRWVWTFDATGRQFGERVGQPTTAQMDQYLLDAQTQIEEAMERGMFR